MVPGSKNGDVKSTKNVGVSATSFHDSVTCSSSTVTHESGAEETTATVYIYRGVRYTSGEGTRMSTPEWGTNKEIPDTSCYSGTDSDMRSEGPYDIEVIACYIADITANYLPSFNDACAHGPTTDIDMGVSM